jgi:thiosulfate/3-mercaptopyruvate sulfurtransferase
VAGHIPGSHCRFFKLNLAEDGCFKAPAQLREEFLALGVQASSVVHQCGSGVTACHNLLAMAHAGLTAGTLYPGSWSEWCSNPARPVARG